MFPLPAGSPFETPEVSSAPPMFGGQQAAPVAPQVPSFGGPVAPAAPQKPSIWQAIAPVAAALIAGGGRDPAAIGSGLAAFQRGKQLKVQQNEHEADRLRRQQIEQAEFYSRMIEQANTIDDPLVFERWKQAIAPVAQVHGLSTDVLTFSDEKRKAKDVKLVQAAVDKAVQLHGADILNNDAVSVSLADGRQVTMPTARGLIGGTVTASGKAVPVPGKKETTSPDDLRKSGLDVQLADAKRRAAKGEPGAADEVKLLEDTILKADTLRRDPRVNVTLGGRDPRQVATFNQIAGAYDRSPLVRASDRTIVLSNAIAQIDKNPSDPASQLSLAYSYIQALDTYQSAVREGELQNLGILGTKLQSFVTSLNRVANEGAFLPPEVAKNIAANAKQLVQTIEAGRTRKEQEFASRAKTSGVGDMWTEFTAGMKTAQAPSATPKTPAASSALSKLEARRKARGQ